MASYVDNNLTKNEEVVRKAEVHWFHFVGGVTALFIGAVLVIETPLGWLLIFGAAYGLIKSYLFHISTELAITSKRVVAKFGFIRRNTIELNHNNVESFKVDQGVFGRIFNFGTVYVNGTGGISTPIPNIANPLEFRKVALDLIEPD